MQTKKEASITSDTGNRTNSKMLNKVNSSTIEYTDDDIDVAMEKLRMRKNQTSAVAKNQPIVNSSTKLSTDSSVGLVTKKAKPPPPTPKNTNVYNLANVDPISSHLVDNASDDGISDNKQENSDNGTVHSR